MDLGISSRFSVEQIDEIMEGAGLACKKYRIDLAGGDTTSSLTGLTISVTSVGYVEKEKPPEERRCKAKRSDMRYRRSGSSIYGTSAS